MPLGANLSNDSERLDNLDSSQFLRKDVSDQQQANFTVAGNFTTNQATTLGNGVGSDPVIVNDSLTVNNGTQLGDSLTDATTITGPLETLTGVTVGGSASVGGNVSITGDLVVDGNNIDNGTDNVAPNLRIDADSDGTGTILLGGSTSDGDDVEIVDGGLCVASAGCNDQTGDGSLRVEGAANVLNQATFGGDVSVGNNPAFDPIGQLIFGGGEADLRWDVNDNDSPSFEFTKSVDIAGYLCVAAPLGSCDAAGIGCIDCILADGSITPNAFDLAERFDALDGDLAAGDLVMFGDQGARVRRTDGTPYDGRVAGIVSGDPGVVLGWQKDGDVPVALQGRVPLNVTIENGPIVPGDYLTSSSTPGFAMKATTAGTTVGVALEAFDGSDGERGQVLTFVARGDGHTASMVQALEARMSALEGGADDRKGDTIERVAVLDFNDDRGAAGWVIALAIGAMVLALGGIAGVSVAWSRGARGGAA